MTSKQAKKGFILTLDENEDVEILDSDEEEVVKEDVAPQPAEEEAKKKKKKPAPKKSKEEEKISLVFNPESDSEDDLLAKFNRSHPANSKQQQKPAAAAAAKKENQPEEDGDDVDTFFEEDDEKMPQKRSAAATATKKQKQESDSEEDESEQEEVNSSDEEEGESEGEGSEGEEGEGESDNESEEGEGSNSEQEGEEEGEKEEEEEEEEAAQMVLPQVPLDELRALSEDGVRPLRRSSKEKKGNKKGGKAASKKSEDDDMEVEGGDSSSSEDEEEDPEVKAFFAADPLLRTDVSFQDLHFSRPILRAIEALEYTKPTPVQARAIPIALAGKDMVASAQTGSGKTAAFMLPILERLLFRPRRIAAIRVLVLMPTRELAMQCQDMTERLAKFTDIRICLLVGGFPTKEQEAALKSRPDIVIATPGRLIDHVMNTPSFGLEDLEILVLDEADRLLDMGFSEELEQVLSACPKKRQTLLFSATMSTEVEKLIKLSMKKPVRVSTDPKNNVASRLVQEFVRIRKTKEDTREAVLLALVTRTYRQGTIIFFGQKKTTHRMKLIFDMAGLNAAELHANLTQQERMKSLEKFKEGKVDFLLCSDIAARGIDIQGIKAVINFEMPRDIRQYIHRVGRTARAGREGQSCTLCSEADHTLIRKVIKHAGDSSKHRIVPTEAVEICKRAIAEMEPFIENAKTEEYLEFQIKKAEREVERAKNIMEHKDEIMARPARTWFMTSGEKEKSKERVKSALGFAEPKAEGDNDGSATTVKTEDDPARGYGQGVGSIKAFAPTNKKGKKRGAEELDGKKKPHNLSRDKKRRIESRKDVDENAMRGARIVARAVKKSAKRARMGLSTEDDLKHAAVARQAKRKANKKKSAFAGGSSGGASATPKKSKSFDERPKKTPARGGKGVRKGGASSAGFKSKKRYQRR